MIASSRRILVALCLVALGDACASPDEVDVRLVHAASLDPSSAFQHVELRVVRESDGSLVHRGELGEGMLGPGTEVAELGNLQPGERYVVEVRADSNVCLMRGRAVGRSLPFEHREGGYRVTVQVGCADEFGVTGRPLTGRLANALVTTTEGEVLLVGGTERAEFGGTGSEVRLLDPVVELERYDASTGDFYPGTSTLSIPHSFGAVVALPDGEVAIAGGFAGEGFSSCGRDVEIISGNNTAIAPSLEHARCWSSAVALAGAGRIAIVGGQLNALDRTRDIELYDSTMRTRLPGSFAGDTYRIRPMLVPLSDGRSALVLGGANAEGSPSAGLLHVGEQCGTEACIVPVGGEPPLAPQWDELSASYAACPSGGGAVYAVGGLAGRGAERAALNDVRCYRDDGVSIGSLRLVGHLPTPRRQHVAAVVRGPGGKPRLLVVGGTGGGQLRDAAHGDALLIPLDPCACTIDEQAIERISLPINGTEILQTIATLPNGSVLVVGGIDQEGIGEDGGIVLSAADEAVLFTPELP